MIQASPVGTELAVVTGGNRGIGLEVGRQLAGRGLRVILASRDLEAGRKAAAALGVEARALDVADGQSVKAFAAGLAGTRLDVLVNNAGVSLPGFDPAGTLAVNYFGAAAVTDALVPLMPPGGRVVMVSSGMGALSGMPAEVVARLTAPGLQRAGVDAVARAFIAETGEGRRHRGWPGNAYSMSKALLNALVRVLAPALAARGIKVNAACPGWVRTDMGGAGAPRSVEQGAASIVWAATLAQDGPTGGLFRDGRAIDW
jgi:NAD(P)-dependent dehydrogenase (short-subunit alcohol dehydrogenase family)